MHHCPFKPKQGNINYIYIYSTNINKKYSCKKLAYIVVNRINTALPIEVLIRLRHTHLITVLVAITYVWQIKHNIWLYVLYINKGLLTSLFIYENVLYSFINENARLSFRCLIIVLIVSILYNGQRGVFPVNKNMRIPD